MEGRGSIRRVVRTPERPIAQHIHDQTRAIPRFRRPPSTACPQKGHRDILGHLGVPVSETVIRVPKVEAVFKAFDNLFVRPVCSSAGVATRCCGRSSAGDEGGDALVQSPLPRCPAVPET